MKKHTSDLASLKDHLYWGSLGFGLCWTSASSVAPQFIGSTSQESTNGSPRPSPGPPPVLPGATLLTFLNGWKDTKIIFHEHEN